MFHEETKIIQGLFGFLNQFFVYFIDPLVAKIFKNYVKIFFAEETNSKKDGTQPLTHVQKGRARPPRNHKVKAPQPPNASDHEGVDVFFAK